MIRLLDSARTPRRRLLKGVGLGAMGVPLVMATPTGQQDEIEVTVEAGEEREDGWTRRDLLTDDFRGKIDLSNLPPDETPVLAMMYPVGGTVEEARVRTEVRTISATSGSVISTVSWKPAGIFDWDDGTYYIYATVALPGYETFGTAISDPFEVDT